MIHVQSSSIINHQIEVAVVKEFYPKVNSTTYYGIDNIQVKFVERYDEVFKCNLDSESCFDLDNDVYYHVFWQDKMNVESKIFTDYTSTST